MSAAAVARYREVAVTTRVLAASGPALTAILYAELADALCLARRAGQLASTGARALAILASLDADLAGNASAFAVQMRTIHRFAQRRVEQALRENDPIWCQAALAEISPIAEAWASVRSNP